MALRHGAQHIRAYLDSELIVDQVNGASNVEQVDLRPLHEAACALRDQFASFRIAWVPREMNKEADSLVREALGK